MTTYTFVRHGECAKNLEDITGGGGASLTRRGAHQVRSAAAGMAQEFTHPRIVSCPPVQAVETAELIAAAMGCDFAVDERLKPAGMGVLTGLRHDEIEQRYPECAHRLRRWRNFELEAHELDVPGMEPPTEFWNRTLAVLTEYEDEGEEEVIIVATRSIVVFAENLRLNRSPEPGGGYRHVAIDHCQRVTVEL